MRLPPATSGVPTSVVDRVLQAAECTWGLQPAIGDRRMVVGHHSPGARPYLPVRAGEG